MNQLGNESGFYPHRKIIAGRANSRLNDAEFVHLFCLHRFKSGSKNVLEHCM